MMLFNGLELNNPLLSVWLYFKGIEAEQKFFATDNNFNKHILFHVVAKAFLILVYIFHVIFIFYFSFISV